MSTLIQSLNENSGAIQGISTSVLVLITLYYSIQTWRTVKEMREARKHEFLPILEIKTNTPTASNSLSINVSNIGKGLARSPEIYMPGLDTHIKIQDLGPRSLHNEIVVLPIADLIGLSEKDRKIKIKYLDVFSRVICSEAVLRIYTPVDDDTDSGELILENWKLILPK